MSEDKFLGKFRVIKALGEGGCSKVKLVEDPSTGQKYAAKIFNQQFQSMGDSEMDMIKKEADLMKQLNHKYMVNSREFELQGQYKKRSGKVKQVAYLILELAQGGELFDYIAQTGQFDERTCRYFFSQMLEAMQHVHEAGFCHRDLKCENILLDKEYNVKIADFGYAGDFDKYGNTGLLRTQLGSYDYMAPEIHQKKPYSGQSVDVFNLAVILFMMATKTNSFKAALPNDQFYKCIAANRADLFWQMHAKVNGKTTDELMTPDLRKLLQAMLQLDPLNRPSIAEIRNHPWMKAPVPSQQDIVKMFNQKQNVVDYNKDMELQAKQQQKSQKSNPNRSKYRAAFKHGQYDKPIQPFIEEDNTKQTVLFTDHHPDGAQLLLMNVISRNKVQVVISPKKYKFDCSMTGVTTDKDNDKVISQTEWTQKFTITITVVDKSGKYCLEFVRKGGNSMQFMKIYEILKEQILTEVKEAERDEDQ